MKMFEFINIPQVIGPLVATIATLLALSGDPVNYKEKGIKKLKWQGYIAIILALIGFTASIVSTSKSNEQHTQEVADTKSSLVNIENQNSNLLMNDSLKDAAYDSLQNVVERLRIDLLLVTSEALEYERKRRRERESSILADAAIEIGLNLHTLNKELSDEIIEGFRNTNYFTNVTLHFEAISKCSELDLDIIDRAKLTILVKESKVLNHDIKEILNTSGEPYEMYLRQIKRNRDKLIERNYDLFSALAEFSQKFK